MPVRYFVPTTGVAEFERALIRHRTDEGREAAKRRGVLFGRPQKLRPDQKTLVLELVQEGRSISAIARTFNVHPATIHRCLNAPQAANPPYDSTPSRSDARSIIDGILAVDGLAKLRW